MTDDLFQFFKSVIDQDDMPVVICNLFNEIVYMNPAAVEMYSDEIIGDYKGMSIQDCHPHAANEKIDRVVRWFSESTDHNKVHTFYSERWEKDVYMIAMRDENGELIGYYEKHESRKKDTSGTYKM